MPHEEDPVSALFELLGRESPELRPICRWLLLGPFLSSTMLGEYSRPPTVREMLHLKRLIEHHGAHFNGLLDNLVEASKAPDVRLATHLERLLELDPNLWTHPRPPTLRHRGVARSVSVADGGGRGERAGAARGGRGEVGAGGADRG